MDFKALNIFAKQRNDINTQLRESEAQLEKKKREREWIEEGIPPKSDVLQLYCDEIDARTEAHTQRIIRFDLSEGQVARWTRHKKVYPILESNGGFAFGDGKAHVNALYAVLSPLIKDYMAGAIERAPWPDEVGPPLAERPALIKKLDAEISKLEKEIQKARDIILRPE